MFRVPIATYRIQFNATFTFKDAKEIVPYLADLGVTEIYSSPILKARKGSGHGYDVVDASLLNPELGEEEDFNALHETLRAHELGYVLDIVPNHMAASQENAWWMSVLENGQQSRYLHYFDIVWNPSGTREQSDEKVLLPILGKPYGEALETGEIQLHFDADGFYLSYYENRLPLAPRTYRQVLRECVAALPREGVGMELRDLIEGEETVPNSRFLKEMLWRNYEQHPEFKEALDRAILRFNGEPGNGESFNSLDTLLDSQAYRLAYWRLASEKINYRRFFDVTDLVGVRIEHPEVFEARYRRILELWADGKITGLRIDHIDGLFDPIGHTQRVQLRLASPGSTGDAPGEDHAKPFYIVLEKILARDEVLPRAFAVSGTTGYDFMDSVNALFVDPSGLAKLDRFYGDFTGFTTPFEQMCYDRKKQVINELFPGEMRGLGKKLAEISMRDRNARDFAPSDVLAALVEITASMNVYRTYIRNAEPSEEDRRRIRFAIDEARHRAGNTVHERLFQFLELVLLLDPPPYLEGERERMVNFVMRWQQFTGRVMAKGVEDTAFYNYNRLISLNEVGGEPGRSPDFDPVGEFHARNERMQRDWPDTMNATSTHDTKRSEDIRARINVLSEIPETWESQVRRWADVNAPLKNGSDVPDRNEELLLYQTLIGMWPIDEEEVDTVPERLRQYLEKASREAKTHTSWTSPNEEFEKRLLDFSTAILSNEEFRSSFLEAQRRVSYHGFLNALAQVVLKMTSPGVPDFYQGTEVWDFSLVDPDNRRPVDYEARRSMLKKLKAGAARGSLDIATMIRRWFDGRIKMYVTWKTLELRKEQRDVFRTGTYRALPSDSPNVVAFLRGDSIAVAVPRLTTQLVKEDQPPVGEVWKDAAIPLPEGTWRNVFTGDEVQSGRLAEVFARFPVAILVK